MLTDYFPNQNLDRNQGSIKFDNYSVNSYFSIPPTFINTINTNPRTTSMNTLTINAHVISFVLISAHSSSSSLNC